MNFPLQKLENHVDEAFLLQGEEIFAAGSVRKLIEAERHLWIAEVESEKIYEIEVKISPSKVLAATCDCQDFERNGSCGHIAAVLFALRREINQQKNKKENRKKNRKKPRKLTTGVVLENVNPEELSAFVRQYAKTNRNFALALKARFASNVSVIESKDKYLQLLDSTLSVARKADRTISLRGSRKVLKVLHEILAHIEDAIAREYYAEAILMAQSIIEKITPVLRKLESHQEEIRGQISLAFKALSLVVEQGPPPTLLHNLWEYLLWECRKLTYRNNEIDTQFYRLLLKMALEEQQQEAFFTLLGEQAYKYQLENRNAAPLVLCQARLHERTGDHNAAFRLLEQNLANPDILRFTLRQAQKLNDLETTKKLAISGLRKDLPPELREEVEELLFRIARQEHDSPSVQHYAHRRFIQTLDFHYYQALQEVCKQDWPALAGRLLAEVQQLPFSPRKTQAIAGIYAREGAFDQLTDYLRQCRSIDLLQHHTPALLAYDREVVFQLYLDVLRQYLHEYLGRKTSRRIRDAVIFLQNNEADQLANRLVEVLRREYGQRQSLMEELEIFNAA